GPARAQQTPLNASPVNDRDFVQGLLDMNLGSLVPELLKQPPSNPSEAAGLRDGLVDAWLPSLRDDLDAYQSALDLIFDYSDRLFEQKAYENYWGRSSWSSDFAQHLLLSALPDLYQAGDFALLGFPNNTQRKIVDKIAARSFKMLERAEDEHYRLSSILRARPDFTTDYVNTGRWDRMQEYVQVNIPYYRTWAVIYLLTQTNDSPYFKQFPDAKTQRDNLIKIATADITNVLAQAERRQLSDDTLVMMHLAAADVALAGGKKDIADQQTTKALTFKEAQPYTMLLAQLTRAKVLQQAGQLDAVRKLIGESIASQAAAANPLNLVLCTDRLFDIDYQAALAMQDPARQKDLMNKAFDIYVKLINSPKLGQWKVPVQQFVENRYTLQIPPNFDSTVLPPPVRFAAIRRAFDEGESLREAGNQAAGKAQYDKVVELSAELLKITDLTKDIEVETRFYMGFAQLRAQKAGEALRTFTELADKFPDTQRGEQAIGVAVVTLGKPIYAKFKSTPAVAKAYGAALKVLVDKYPNTELAKLGIYDYAAFLRESDQYQQAVETYDKVGADHPAYLSARYERLACLGAIWADAPVDQKAILSTSLLSGVDDFNKLVTARLPQLPPDRALAARRDLANAMLLNAAVFIETTNQPAKAQQVIDEVTERFGDVPDLTTRITGLKIRIFQRQKKYAEAEVALRQYMQKEPEKAGQLATGLLQSLNMEIRDTANSKNPDAAELAKLAQVAVNLADNIVIPWAKTQNPKPEEMIAYELMSAQSLLAAKEYEQAIKRFDDIIKNQGEPAKKNVDVLQGQAEALFGLQRYQDAAAVYSKLIVDRQNRKTPLYDHVFWKAQMRFYEMMDAQAGDKPTPEVVSNIVRGINRLSHQDPDLGGEPYKTALQRLLTKYAQR
ncbi:MAG: tetratricopeptide repeat protein, partial [Phycisphaeraceae bacterium]